MAKGTSTTEGRRSNNEPKKVALVTGATSGIGKAIAEAFACDGIDLIITGRNESALISISTQWMRDYGISVTALPCDLSVRGGAQMLFDQIVSAGTEIDYLVNNAGIGVYGKFLQSDLGHELAMIELNIVSPTILCKKFLPQLMRRKGKIMNVASTASFQPGPYMAVYYATKAYLLFLSEALSTELNGTSVTVTTLCPGPTRSGFEHAAQMSSSGIFKNKSLPSAKEVGLAGYRALQSGKQVFVPGLTNKLLANATRILPRKWVVRIVSMMSSPR